MARDIPVDSVVAIRLKLVVGDAAKAGISRVQCRGFLVQIRVRNIEREAMGKTMLDLGLECIGLGMTVISVAQ